MRFHSSQEGRASPVVVGSRGLGALGNLLLGSTAVYLAAHAGCLPAAGGAGPARLGPSRTAGGRRLVGGRESR
ncbi:universal stress protein [Streptomyces canus]|uniref:universal stress protein n=1 Tax=Streptomyces canus TaxID=58343 RepID=UPI0039A66478